MKLYVSLGAVALLFFGWFFFFRAESVRSFTNYPPQNEMIVAFGDSLVQGVGATEGNDLFSQVSRVIGMPIVNKGVSGNTTGQALERIDDVVGLRPGVVVVVLGGNDFLQSVPVETTFKNLRTIVKILQKNGAIVILAGVRGGVLSDKFADEYEALARESRAGYIPSILKGLLGREQYMADSVHPNSVGYGIIAAKIAPVLSELYQK
jgi:lysophospholipase L1-like esterase